MTPTITAVPLGKMLAVFIGMLIAGNALVVGIEYVLPDLTMPSSMGMVFVMVGAIGVHAVARRLILRRTRPLFDVAFDVPSLRQIDARLGTLGSPAPEGAGRTTTPSALQGHP